MNKKQVIGDQLSVISERSKDKGTRIKAKGQRKKDH